MRKKFIANKTINVKSQNTSECSPCTSASPCQRDKREFDPSHDAAMSPHSPLVERAISKSALPYESFVRLLTQGAFRGVEVWTSSDLDRLLMAAERYGLDPLSREIFMMPSYADPSSPLLVVVGVDGWTRLINTHEQFDGLEFSESCELEQGVPTWIECTIYRRDRRVPLKVREYFCEA